MTQLLVVMLFLVFGVNSYALIARGHYIVGMVLMILMLLAVNIDIKESD